MWFARDTSFTEVVSYNIFIGCKYHGHPASAGKEMCAQNDEFLWSDFDGVIYHIIDFTPKLEQKVTSFGALCKKFVMCAKI